MFLRGDIITDGNGLCRRVIWVDKSARLPSGGAPRVPLTDAVDASVGRPSWLVSYKTCASGSVLVRLGRGELGGFVGTQIVTYSTS